MKVTIVSEHKVIIAEMLSIAGPSPVAVVIRQVDPCERKCRAGKCTCCPPGQVHDKSLPPETHPALAHAVSTPVEVHNEFCGCHECYNAQVVNGLLPSTDPVDPVDLQIIDQAGSTNPAPAAGMTSLPPCAAGDALILTVKVIDVVERNG